MADETAISWCTHTWSPWLGCTKVSPACDHCYAEAWAKRSGLVGWGPHAERRRTSESYWNRPFKWDAEAKAAGTRPRVFPSLCDPFDNQVPPEWRRDFFWLINATPHLDWLLLTKRVGNVVHMLNQPWPRNAWLGATVINQEEANRDVPTLLDAKARLRVPVAFLSVEPMLGPIDLREIVLRGDGKPPTPLSLRMGDYIRPLSGCFSDSPRIDQVIAGGEQSPRSRPAHPDWFRSLRDQCAEAGVAFHFKQHGDWVSVYDRDREDPDWQRCAEVARQHPGSRWMNLAGGHGFHGERVQLMRRVGTKAAGRLLDDQLHNAFPEPRP